MTEDVRMDVRGRGLDGPLWGRIQDRLNARAAAYRKVSTVRAFQLKVPISIDTPEGTMTAEPGDYLVTDDPPTHAWPVKREVFERTYQALP